MRMGTATTLAARKTGTHVRDLPRDADALAPVECRDLGRRPHAGDDEARLGVGFTDAGEDRAREPQRPIDVRRMVHHAGEEY